MAVMHWTQATMGGMLATTMPKIRRSAFSVRFAWVLITRLPLNPNTIPSMPLNPNTIPSMQTSLSTQLQRPLCPLALDIRLVTQEIHLLFALVAGLRPFKNGARERSLMRSCLTV